MAESISNKHNVPLVSVIVLTCNHRAYIRQAMNSVLSQDTMFAYEILVGDDASTDGTQEILSEYAEKYPEKIKLFLRAQNLGASRNAYDLMQQARGKYLATCEGDDYWTDPEKLQLQVAYLEAHPEAIGCVHRFTIVDENGNPRKNQKIDWVRQKPVFRLQDFQGIYLPGQLAAFVRHNIYLRPKHDYSVVYKAHPMVADRTSMLLYLSEGEVHLIDRYMSCYRKIIRKDGQNLTSICFAGNPCRVQEEYGMLKELECCSWQLYHHKIRFEMRRRELFADAVIRWVLYREKSSFLLAKQIFCESRGSLLFFFYAVWRFFYKAVRRLFAIAFRYD